MNPNGGKFEDMASGLVCSQLLGEYALSMELTETANGHIGRQMPFKY
ncbi:hypothetical protein L915_06735 [Phytophthora nicotianae]|uniref:Uncharacterized protein n=1 Tax=Phytophthora nicotianae TaxID=4792 RepID=W2H1J7_PHYNI|nr:hypothetical protein L915_06735 [Phytophthora nicotianae]ETL42523.1 hypothetical protein L916_06673 [Phytophthora nicotianae]